MHNACIKIGRYILTFGVFSALLLTAFRTAAAQTENILYSFGGQSGDGDYPLSTLVKDKKGNLYGTTWGGGANGTGTVFKLSPSGTETVLHSFCTSLYACPDGANPESGVILDTAGNLYGTTSLGGPYGAGTVYQVTPSGTETLLYSFTGGADGARPYAGVVLDKAGNLYGTTTGGGANGAGTVFQLTSSGGLTVLHTFAGPDGNDPNGGVILDSKGNLYGTTVAGGAHGYGTVYKLSPGGTETVLYSFTGGADGGVPARGLVLKKGYLYGTTTNGYGTVFKVSLSGKATVLYSFTGAGDGGLPTSEVIFDKNGNLYSTTYMGGLYNEGTVFELTPTGTETALYSFGSQSGDGALPDAGLVFDKKGNLYGTTLRGGLGGVNGGGIVFKLVP